MAGALGALGCGKQETSAPAPAEPAAAPAAATAPAAPAEPATPEAEPAMLEPTAQTWTPEALEELLAPIALYPDIVLGQVLVASANPQEVLDAGNWLLQNESLSGDALDEAAKGVGFTPPVRALMQSRDVVDMMCSEMGWTTELGQAYVNDQAGVLEAVQRLRAQAKDAGNLASSAQMKVETAQQEGQEVITLSPPSPEVVYVPTYDPVAVYAPPAATTTAAPAASTTTAVTEGHSTGALVATGLLSFGAGLLVGEVFDDDDDWDDWYHPHYYGPPMPYYPPYAYRPHYGGGFYPGYGYNRPGFNNNDVNININQNNNYWNRYDNKKVTNRQNRRPESPISAARPNRPELGKLNNDAARGPKRPAPSTQDAWKGKNAYKGKTTYDGAKPSRGKDARPQAVPGKAPKVQGSYAGAKRAPTARPSGMPSAKPAVSGSKYAAPDRGRVSSSGKPAVSAPSARPSASRAAPSRPSKSAVSGVDRGKADRAASQRGKQSLSKSSAGKSKGGGGAKRSGGGGSGKKNKR
jgi:hypothetical protein